MDAMVAESIGPRDPILEGPIVVVGGGGRRRGEGRVEIMRRRLQRQDKSGRHRFLGDGRRGSTRHLALSHW